VNETYFFRELDPLKRMVADIIAPLAAAGGRPRIWCAASSTGEEPLTIAMLLADKGILADVDLVASDISSRVLAKAQAGVFGPRSIRSPPPAGFSPRFFTEEAGRFRVQAELISAIQWRRINLIDTAAIADLGAFDAVVCRNVLIYFADPTARRVIDNLISALRPRGALFVGASESLLRFGTPLSCEERGGVFLYRKEPQ
jgi:chemotaxis protein methyltransferase CheR